jgi:1-acyl-sn-glycerol-3-phosphate acyltransferase
MVTKPKDQRPIDDDRRSVRRLLDAAFAALARTVLRIFFRGIEIRGTERIPPGPVVLVANHPNGLADGLLLLGFLPRRVRAIARSTLWRNPAVRPFLAFAGTVPVYRPQDAAAEMWKNARCFSRCHDLLAQGGAIVIFPEGRSHDGKAILLLKTGAARIVLEARANLGLDVRVVPVGMRYDAKDCFRSCAYVEIGEPMDVEPEVARYTAAPQPAVRRLTDRIALRLEHLARAPVEVPVPPKQVMFVGPAVAGMIANALPCALTMLVARTARREMRASYAIVAGFYLFPLFWLLETALGVALGGLLAGLGTAVAALVGGWAAIVRLDAWARDQTPLRAAA